MAAASGRTVACRGHPTLTPSLCAAAATPPARAAQAGAGGGLGGNPRRTPTSGGFQASKHPPASGHGSTSLVLLATEVHELSANVPQIGLAELQVDGEVELVATPHRLFQAAVRQVQRRVVEQLLSAEPARSHQPVPLRRARVGPELEDAGSEAPWPTFGDVPQIAHVAHRGVQLL